MPDPQSREVFRFRKISSCHETNPLGGATFSENPDNARIAQLLQDVRSIRNRITCLDRSRKQPPLRAPHCLKNCPIVGRVLQSWVGKFLEKNDERKKHMKTIMKATNILSKSLRLIGAAPTRDFRARITLPLLVSGLLATTGVSYGQNVVAQIPIPSSSQYSVDLNTSSNTVFVSGGASGGQTVTKINGNTNQVVGPIGAGSGAHVNSMTNRLYAGDVLSVTFWSMTPPRVHLWRAFPCRVVQSTLR